MSMSDPIADMLTRIRNAILRHHKSVVVPHSRVKENIVAVLKAEGFINDFSKEEAKVGSELKVVLKYDRNNDSVIRKIDRVSKPGLRINKGYKDLKPFLGGQGIYVVSTSRGLKSDAECRAEKLGGEVLCSIF